jgi:cytoskeletal protein CcmA (bactofilin family)
MALTRIPSSLVANTFTANTVLFANALGYLSNTSNFRYFSGNNTIAVGAVVADGIDVISYTQAAFSAANAAGSSAYVQSAYNQANTATGIAQAAFNSANNVAPQVQPAFDKANTASANTIIIQGVDLTQNTRINSIETINNNQNTTIAIIQGVDLTQNTRLDGIEGTNLTQNTNITTANNAAWAAYAAGNTNSTNITYVNQFAQSAYNAANAAGSSAYVQAAFDKANNALANTSGTFAGNLTTTGNVKVSSTQAATSTTTGALTVSGGVGVSGNLYAGNIYTNGALINNAAALIVYKYVATAGQTTFTGTDSNALTLSYAASAIFVTLNGVVLSNTLEYTATNGTSVVLGTAAELDDELNIYSFGAFQLADTYTTSQADSKFLTQINAVTDYVSTANGTAINQFAAGAYTTANGANGLAASAYNTANGANGLAAGAYNTANGANGLAAGAYNKANTAITTSGGSITGSLAISQNLTVSGNLTVLGNSTSISVSTLEVSDPLIVLGIGNYTTDIVDIGFAGHYNDGTANAHTGIIRDAGTKEYYFFKNYTPELDANNNINIAHPTFATTNVYASFFKGNVISQGYNLFNYSSAAYTQANTAYTNSVNGSNTSVQFASLGVGTAASGIAGEIRASNNITAYYSSDKKYKENIIDIPNALNKVDAIGGKMFDWTDSYIQEHGGEDGYFVQKRDFGVIAQDVQAVFPEAVRTREDGSLAVDYSKLSALAFAAIVELKKEIEQLKK